MAECLALVEMSISTLRWISIIGPTIFVIAFEITTRALYSDLVPPWGHALVALTAVLTAAILFSRFVFATMARLEREIRERNKRLALLNTLSTKVSEYLDTSEVAAITGRRVVSALDAAGAGIALIDAEGDLRLISQEGLGEHSLLSWNDAPVDLRHDCECRKVVALGDTVVVPDTLENPSCTGLLSSDKRQTCITAPIKSKGKDIGAIFVARPASRPFSEEETELVTAVGAHVGIFFENAQTFTKTEALAVMHERERVAREVHDGLAQTLGYLNVQMGIVDHLLRAGDVAAAHEELDEMSAATREAYSDLRQAIVDLRISLPSPTGLRRALREYGEDFSRRTGITCRFEGHRGVAAAVSPAAEVQVIRIVQEALANVRKHSHGSEVLLRVEATEREARVRVQDNGIGFDLEAVSNGDARFGLRTMQERAASVGGRLTVQTARGAGTAVEVVVPAGPARRR
jgi:nitrate/nitrite-specific signal transduction histidine kinase